MAMLLNQQQARGVRKLATSTPLFFRFESKGVINTTTLNITNNISLKNIFSYRKFDISRGFDLDGTTLQILDVINPFKGYTKLCTEEVQLRADFDRVRGVIGYYDEKLNEPTRWLHRRSSISRLLAARFQRGAFRNRMLRRERDLPK